MNWADPEVYPGIVTLGPTNVPAPSVVRRATIGA